MSSPSTPKGSTFIFQPKTPGWMNALFGSSKKPAAPGSVDTSTTSTQMNGGMSFGAASAQSHRDSTPGSPAIEDFQSPTASQQSPEGATGFSFSVGTSPTKKGGQKRQSRLNISSLSSRKSHPNNNTTSGTPAPNRLTFGGAGSGVDPFRNSKSPWQSRGAASKPAPAAASAEPSVWQGSRSRSNEVATSTSLSFLSNATSDRARRYRPNSGLLTGSKGGRRYRRTGKLEEAKFGKALTDVRDVFLPFDTQDTSTNVYSTKGGIRWGSLNRPSRIPQAVHKRQRPAERMRTGDDEEEEDFGERSSKRRKKVSFDHDNDDGNAVMTSITATPHGNKGRIRRKATPMPKKGAGVSFGSPVVEDASDEEDDEFAPSLQRKDLPPAPARLDLTIGPLNSDTVLPLHFPSGILNSFDPKVATPATNEHKFRFDNTTPATVSAEGIVSTQSKSDFEGKRYERPLSPVHRRGFDTPTGPDGGDPEQAHKRSKHGDSNDEEAVPDWVCTKCGTKNDNEETRCLKVGCGNVRQASGVSLGWGNLFQNQNKGKWKCNVCDSYVDDKFDTCQSCLSPKGSQPTLKGAKPAAPSPAPASSTTPNKPSPVPNNSSPAPASGGKFVFGKQTGSLPIPAGNAEESKFTFQAPPAGSSTPATAGGFTFAAPPSSATGTNGFIFKAPENGTKSESKKEASGTTGFSFTPKAPATAASTPAASNTPGGFVFGGTSVPKSTSKESPGSTSKSPATTAASSGAKPSAPSASHSKLSASAKPFSFTKPLGENGDKKTSGTPTTGAGNEAAKAGFAFGTSSASKTTPAAPFVFGSTNGGSTTEEKKTQADPPTPAAFSFGQDKAAAASASSGFKFGATPGAEPKPPQPASTGGFSFTSPPAASSSGFATSFGAASSSTVPTSSKSEQKPKRQRGYDLSNGDKTKVSKTPPAAGAALFGAPAPASAAPKAPSTVGATGTFSFAASSSDSGAASTSTPAASFPSTGFGSTAAPPASAANGTSKPFAFGAASSQTPAPPPAGFGAPSGATPAAAPAGFSATAPAATSFGNTPAAPSVPGSGFGATPAAPVPAPAFGSTPAPATFGATATPGFGTTFGGTPAPAPAPGFSFGGSSSAGFSTKTPAQTPAPGGFGAPAANSTAPGFGAPGFGNQTPAATTGFNSAAFGSAPNTGFGTAPTPAPAGGFGSTGFGAPSGGGFPSTPAPAGFGGGSFGAPTPQPPATGGGGFSIGTTGTKQRRRMVRAKRPTRPA